jgi:hypothetical protein
MDWREYEKEVANEFAARYPRSKVTWNVKLPGSLSGIARQIDILVESALAGVPFRTAIDTKMYNRAVDVKDVEEFLGMMADVGVERGFMVTTQGYSPAALERAHRDTADIELDVLSLAEFKEFQSPIGIPFSGNKAVILPAPFGWVVDANVCGAPAVMYQRGLAAHEAKEAYEWAYTQFWHKDVKESPSTIEGVLAKQDDDLKGENSNTELLRLPLSLECKYPCAIRLAKRPHYPAWEYNMPPPVREVQYCLTSALGLPPSVQLEHPSRTSRLIESRLPMLSSLQNLRGSGVGSGIDHRSLSGRHRTPHIRTRRTNSDLVVG